MRMLFVNLPVRDLATARAFYEALGFSIHEHFSDDGSVAVNLDDNIALMLHSRERFAEHVPGEVGDPAAATTVVNRLTVEDRSEVDELVEKALAAGGREWRPEIAHPAHAQLSILADRLAPDDLAAIQINRHHPSPRRTIARRVALGERPAIHKVTQPRPFAGHQPPQS